MESGNKSKPTAFSHAFRKNARLFGQGFLSLLFLGVAVLLAVSHLQYVQKYQEVAVLLRLLHWACIAVPGITAVLLARAMFVETRQGKKTDVHWLLIAFSLLSPFLFIMSTPRYNFSPYKKDSASAFTLNANGDIEPQ